MINRQTGSKLPEKHILCFMFSSIIFLMIGCGEKSSQTPKDLFLEANNLGKNGKYKKAIQAYSRAIKLDSQYTDAYVFRGLTYLELGNFKNAINDLDKSILLDPSPDHYRTRADVFARNEYFEKALKDYNKLLDLDTNNASGNRNRAVVYGEIKNYQKALEDITRAVKIEPGDPRWRYDRAILKAKSGDYSSAMIDAENALGLLGGEPDLGPGEKKAVSEEVFNCMQLITDLEKSGAKRLGR